MESPCFSRPQSTASHLFARTRSFHRPTYKRPDRDLWLHSGQTTGHSREHARDLSTSGQFPSSSHKIPRSTSATRAISVLSSIILPLQTFFSRVLLLRQQPFSSENLPPERPTTTIAIKTQVFMFRYESVNSTRKFTIVAEIVSLLKKIYKRDAPFRAVFKVKTLAVLFLAYPREMKHIPRNLNLPPFCRCLFLWKWCNPFPRARARLKHAHSFDRCGTSGSNLWLDLWLMAVPLRSKRSQGLAGMQRDKAPVEWPRSEGGDPTEGSMLGRLLWKPTPKRGPLHESHWTKPVEKGKGIGETKRGGGND